jgi:hypothetical protein
MHSSYSEMGLAIIERTLNELFPLSQLELLNTAPLYPSQFITWILVPQVGLLLIQEDLGESEVAALKTMHDSVQYGVGMFPYEENSNIDKGSEANVEDVGGAMVLERSTRRRTEGGRKEESGEDGSPRYPHPKPTPVCR